MKREELKNLGLEDAQIEKVMGAYGKDVKSFQKQISDLTSERDSFKSQAEESGVTIEELKKSVKDNEEAKKAIDQWQAKAEAATKELESTKKENAVELALRDAGALNARAVKALLDGDTINFKDGKISGLEEQIKALKGAEDSKFLFKSNESSNTEDSKDPNEPEKPKPRLLFEGNPNPSSVNSESLAEKIANRLSK